MSHFSERLLNVALRSLTLGTRFLLIFFLAKYLDPAAVGYYGLFAAAIGYALYFVGLDFYAYVTREIIRAPNDQRGQMLKGQLFLSSVLYVLLLPIALIFLYYSDWPASLLWWFLPLLLLEHLNQEFFRLMVAMSEQITASVLLFLRQGSWAIVTVFLFYFYPSSRNLNMVLILWAIAGLAAAILAIWKIKQLNMGGWRSQVDWSWIKKGIGISFAFLLATLALRGINTFDRYWIELLGGIDVVAAYVLLIGIAGTLMTFLDAGIFAYAYPALIKHHHNQEHAQARAKVRQVIFQTLIFSVFFAFISWMFLPYLLDWIGKSVYFESIHFYPWLLLATVLNAISMAPHFGLYAYGKDKAIIYSHTASLLVFILVTWLLFESYGPLAVVIGLNFAFAVILVWKSLAYWRACKSFKSCTVITPVV